MSDIFNICIPCRLCCDGTLIGFVKLENNEHKVLADLMDIEEVDDNRFFFHPCTKLSNEGCTIYSQRPKQCGYFKCKILKSVEKKELKFETAIEAIKVLKLKKLIIDKQLENLPYQFQIQSFYFKILELKKQHDKNLLKLNPDLIANLKEFDKLVTISFGLSIFN